VRAASSVLPAKPATAMLPIAPAPSSLPPAEYRVRRHLEFLASRSLAGRHGVRALRVPVFQRARGEIALRQHAIPVADVMLLPLLESRCSSIVAPCAMAREQVV